jgi:hypothetical protein
VNDVDDVDDLEDRVRVMNNVTNRVMYVLQCVPSCCSGRINRASMMFKFWIRKTFGASVRPGALAVTASPQGAGLRLTDSREGAPNFHSTPRSLKSVFAHPVGNVLTHRYWRFDSTMVATCDELAI